MGQRSCMNGFAAGKNASLSCERSGLRFAHTVGLPALHRSGHLHMVGNKLPSTANRQFASLNATQVWCAPTATNHGNFPLAHFVHSQKKIFRDFRSLRDCYSGIYPRTPFLLSADTKSPGLYRPGDFLIFYSLFNPAAADNIDCNSCNYKNKENCRRKQVV